MVDSITPATTDALRAQVASVTGVNDAWPIQREGFTQWVIEPDFIERPALDEVGVVFSNDVEAFERAKLRLLNGSHSTLAYMGLHLGLETVFEAVTDPALGNFARAMMLEEILPGLTLPKELDGHAYSESLLARYRNKAIRHELAQIAWDGSQKLPIRILATVEENLASGRPVGRLAAAVAAWLHFVLKKARAGEAFKDPHAEKLAALALKTLSADESDILGFVRGSEVFSDRLMEDAGFLHLLALQFNRLKGTGDGSAVDLSTLLAAA
jgi:fructuronate reductase